jgi:hypothetical protein
MNTNPSLTAVYELISNNGFGEVRENKAHKHKSFHALQNFAAGDVICEFGARELLDHPTYLTVQIDEAKHILLSPEFVQYINHSCDPNVFFDTTSMLLVCVQPINIGDELTFFYPSTEWKMDRPFQCHCGAAECLKKIQGAYYISDKKLAKYRLTDFIKNKVKNNPHR